jgi:hypothetical protein
METENFLIDMNITEVSLVTEPSNDEARVMFVKMSKGSDSPGFETCKGCKSADACSKARMCATKSPAAERFAKLSAVLHESGARKNGAITVATIIEKIATLRDEIEVANSDEALTSVQRSNTINESFEKFSGALDELVPEAAISKAVADTMASFTKGDNPDAIVQELHMDQKELAEALEKAEATIEKLKADLVTSTATISKLEKAAKQSAPDAADEVIFEGMSPVAIAKFKEQRDEVALMKAAIAKQETDKLVGELTTVFKAAGIPDFEKVAAAFQRVSIGKAKGSEKSVVDGKEVMSVADVDVLKQALLAKAATASAPLGALGKVVIAKSEDDGSDPEAELKEKAAGIAKAKKITVEAAFAEAMDENPELYQRYRVRKAARTVVHN